MRTNKLAEKPLGEVATMEDIEMLLDWPDTRRRVINILNAHEGLRLAIFNAMAKICNVHHVENVKEAYAILEKALNETKGE